MQLDKIFDDEIEIRGTRIVLRQVSLRDAEQLLPMYADESIYQFRPGMPRKSLPLVEKLLMRMQKEMEDKKAVYLAVWDGVKIIGVAEVYDFDIRVEQVEIGYTILPSCKKQGYATETIGILTDYLILQVGFNRVRALVHSENIPSQKALLRNGFTLEGKERQGAFWQGIGFVDICRFAKLKMDYEA